MDLQQKLHGLVAKDMSIKFDRHQLCSLCRLLASESGIVRGLDELPLRPDNEVFPYHDTKDDMIKAVLEGCHLCASVEDRFGDALMFPSSLRLWRKSRSYGWIAAEPLKRLPNPAMPLRMNYYIRKKPEHGPWWTPHQASLYTGSNASLTEARNWLLQCQKNHSSCQLVLKSSRARPRRLLEVGENYDSTIRVCLSESLTVPSELEYLTLSHCWGKVPVIQLNESNGSTFQALHRSIPFDSLPLTFQHAVTITRTLGFRYLWIDTLCIIQDSEQDWIEQSAIMGAIYRGGACNIAATSSKDSRGGCFVTRNPLLYTPCNLGGRKTRPTVVMQPRGYHTGPRPLSSRAWAFQERILSPRTLHFGPTGIDWECTEFCESPTGPYHGDLKQALCGLKSQVTPPFDFHSSEELWSFLQSWANIVSTFCSCEITCPKDRLVAFNGIIEEASRKSSFTSVAGLWKEVLPLELLWHRKERIPMANPDASGNNDVTKVYIAPSWAWAACNEGITPYYSATNREGVGKFTLKINLRVLEISVTTESNGLVFPGAYLRVSGPTRRVSWSECCIKQEESERRRNKDLKWFLDQSLQDLEDVHLLLIVRTTDEFTVENFAYTLGAYPEHEPPDFRKVWKRDKGLILQQLNDQPSAFRRVGFFSQFHAYCDEQIYEEEAGLLFPSSLLDSIKTFTIL